MIQAVLDLQDTEVANIMQPRVDVVALPTTANAVEMLSVNYFATENLTRFTENYFLYIYLFCSATPTNNNYILCTCSRWLSQQNILVFRSTKERSIVSLVLFLPSTFHRADAC
jgi:hypothetical protein